MSKKNNILIVWDRMGDYHRARLAALYVLSAESLVIGADLGSSDALYGWQTAQVDGCGYVCLSDRPIGKFDFFVRMNNFRKAIKTNRVGRVGIAGYGRPEYIGFMILAKIYGCSTVMFSESWYSKNKLLNWCKGRLLSVLVDGFLVSGSRVKAHLIHDLAINRTPIQIGYSAVDNAHFAGNSVQTPNIHVSKSKILLCVARFSPEKNLVCLLENFKKSDLITAGWQLYLVGGGPQGQLLKTLADTENIKLLAWQMYQDLPDLYGRASAFVLPSVFEPWGLVVNEAMAAGLPVLVSSQCGCFPELDLPTCGYGFDGLKPDQLLDILNQLAAQDPKQLLVKGYAAKQKIADFDLHSWARKFISLHTK